MICFIDDKRFKSIQQVAFLVNGFTSLIGKEKQSQKIELNSKPLVLQLKTWTLYAYSILKTPISLKNLI